MAKAAKKTVSFEDNLARIESIVSEFEQQQTMPLEQAISYYEEGIRLIKECQKALSAAEQKVLILSEGKNEE